MAAIKYKKSDTGYYEVTLNRVFEHSGFAYKPSASKIVVNEDLLNAMITESVVDTVVPSK